MIEAPFAKDQVRRMRSLEGYPRFSEDGAAELELAKALRSRARDKAHAEQLIAAWIATHTKAPKPVELSEFSLTGVEEFKLEYPVKASNKGAFVDRGTEYQDKNWQAVCAKLGLPQTREFYNASWDDPPFFMRTFSELIATRRLLSDQEKLKLSRSLYEGYQQEKGDERTK